MGPTAVLEGGPARIDSDRYQISAKAGDAVSKEMMNGPMLRALLEERFRLADCRQERPQTPTVERRECPGGPWRSLPKLSACLAAW